MPGPFNVLTPGTTPNSGALQVPALDWAGATRIGLTTTGAISISTYSSDHDFCYEACASQNCWYAVGATATANAAGSQYLSAGALRYVYLRAGQTISAIPDTTDGSLQLIPF